MKKITKAVLISIFTLLLITGSSYAAMMTGAPSKSLSGKLITIRSLKDRYKFIINKRALFILKDESKQEQQIVKTAKSLINKKVTITYQESNDLILSINPFKNKVLY